MLYIYTLGDFDIRHNNSSLFDGSRYAYRTIKLFKYLLTYRDKKLVPETIIEDLWPNENFENPKNVLRTQISRLRREFYKNEKLEVFFDISSINGYYVFRLNSKNCELDVDMFGKKIENGNSLRDKYPTEAIDAYKDAISLYKGKYFSEIEFEEWLMPSRNRNERLYLQSVYRLIGLLEKSDRYNEIVDICEEAMRFQPYNENLNIYFIEALFNMGDKKCALTHYEYITSKLYKELDMVPSNKMRELYRRIKNQSLDTRNIEISSIDEKFCYDLKRSGPFKCDLDYFCFLYNIEKRRSTRKGEKKEFIGLITLNYANYSDLPIESFSQPMDDLEKVMFSSLRKGDVFSIWNKKQIVFILFNLEEKNVTLIEERINENFGSINQGGSFYLKIKVSSIES